jgi:hypothetical protein
LSGSDWPKINKFLNRDLLNVDEYIIKEILDNIYLKAYYDPSSAISVIDIEDLHPVPLEHLKYLDIVIPDTKISDETKNWVNNVNARVVQKGALDDMWKPMVIERI